MPKQPAEYGKKEIKELCEDSVQLLSKEMGLTGMTDMSTHRVKQMKKDSAYEILHNARDILRSSVV
jgi:hypothetical protein